MVKELTTEDTENAQRTQRRWNRKYIELSELCGKIINHRERKERTKGTEKIEQKYIKLSELCGKIINHRGHGERTKNTEKME